MYIAASIYMIGRCIVYCPILYIRGAYGRMCVTGLRKVSLGPPSVEFGNRPIEPNNSFLWELRRIFYAVT